MRIEPIGDRAEQSPQMVAEATPPRDSCGRSGGITLVPFNGAAMLLEHHRAGNMGKQRSPSFLFWFWATGRESDRRAMLHEDALS